MKKLALALAAAAAVVLGSAGIADAYPPNGESVTVDDSSVGPGAPVSITANCTTGETVTFTLEASSTTAVCVDDDDDSSALGGTATGTLSAPSAPGTYTGTVTGSVSGALGSFTVVVEGATATTTPGATPAPTGGLPATGSDGTSTMTMVAGGLLVAGLGMFGVATARRRQSTSAA